MVQAGLNISLGEVLVVVVVGYVLFSVFRNYSRRELGGGRAHTLRNVTPPEPEQRLAEMDERLARLERRVDSLERKG